MNYTKQQTQNILALYKAGKKPKEIAAAYNTNAKSIGNLVYYYTKRFPDKEMAKTVSLTVGGVEVAKVPEETIERKEQPVKNVEKVREMTQREMIKKLYDDGYRIEGTDWRLVCYVKQSVNLKDIVTNG